MVQNMDSDGYVTLEAGTLVGRCETDGVVTDDDIDSTPTVGQRACARCGAELAKVVSLSKPLEVSASALA